MTPLSILFVTARFPHPMLSGDRVRAFHQLRLLARHHRVTLVTYSDGTTAPDRLAQVAALGVRVITVPFDRVAALWRVALSVFTSEPLQAALFDSPRMRQAIAQCVADTAFDVAHVQLARAAPLVPASLGVPRVVDLVDALSLNMQRRANADHGAWRWAARMDAARLRRLERQVCRDASAATVVAKADREAIGAGAAIDINANGVDLSAFPFSTDPRVPGRIVFSGNLGYFPNVEAICWFVDEVLPIVWRSRADAHLVIAGVRPHRRVTALAGRDTRIQVTGYVDRMGPVLASASVAVAPMTTGSGQLLKVLEAMATGTPVVSTALGVSGIDARDGEHVLVADTAEAFAAHVVSLLGDSAVARAQAQAAHDLVVQRYTWERCVAQLEALYLAAVARARPAVPCA